MTANYFSFLMVYMNPLGHRINMLMLSPLPLVESACALLQHEESQRELLNTHKHDPEISTIFNKNNSQHSERNTPYNNERNTVCTVCGLKGHTHTRCWHVVGYPNPNTSLPLFNPTDTNLTLLINGYQTNTRHLKWQPQPNHLLLLLPISLFLRAI